MYRRTSFGRPIAPNIIVTSTVATAVYIPPLIHVRNGTQKAESPASLSVLPDARMSKNSLTLLSGIFPLWKTFVGEPNLSRRNLFISRLFDHF